MLDQLISGDRRTLARCITWSESQIHDQRTKAMDLLVSALAVNSRQSMRLGISGPPGVGKSCLIEEIGMSVVRQGDKKVAVLSIDPTSPIHHGSILADKTRMPGLSAHANAFVRPTPSGSMLGGVARRTREAILLCEVAGYDVVIIETVGVGQSEISVQSMCDAFVVLQQPYSGDEIQGIKKGLLEMADFIAVTKADGESMAFASRTLQELKSALGMLRGADAPSMHAVSSVTRQGVDDLLANLMHWIEARRKSGDFRRRREKQALAWLDEEISLQFLAKMKGQAKSEMSEYLSEVTKGILPASVAAERILTKTFELKGV